MEERSSSSDRNDRDEEDVLREAFEHIKALRKENSALRDNFENLKKLHVALTESNKQLQEKCSNAYEERLAVEKQYQRLCESWKEEVADKQRAFDDAQAKILQPRDIERARLKMMEELEAPHRQKCHSLEQEAERAHEGYMQAKREVETLKSQLETLSGKYAKEVALLRSEHTAAMADTEAEIIRLREACSLREDVEGNMHSMAKDLAALQMEKRELLAEISSIRQEKETAVADRQRCTMDLERTLHESQASSQNLRRHADNLARKCRYLETELERSNIAAAASHNALMAASRERDSVAAQLEQRVHQLEQELGVLQAKMVEQEKNWDEERVDFQAILEDKDRMRQVLMGAHEEDLEMQRRLAAQSAAESEERQRSARRAIEGEAADLRAALQGMEEALADAEVRHAEATDEARKELDSVRRDLGKARVELESVRRSLGEARDTAAMAQAEAEEARNRLGEEEQAHGALQQLHRQSLLQISDLRGESERLMERAEQLERALTEAVERAEKDRQEHLAQMDAAHREFSAERAAAAQMAGDLAEQERDRLKQQLLALGKKLKRLQRAVLRLSGDKQDLMIQLAKAEARGLASQPVPHLFGGGGAEDDGRDTVDGHALLTLDVRSTAWFKVELERLRERQAKYIRP